MASANQRKAFICHKLTFLKDQHNHFINDVGQSINGIIMAGETWTEDEVNKIGYLELGQMIESAVVFLSEKCEVLTGSTLGVEANPLLQAPGEQSDRTPLSTAISGFAPPASLRKSAGPVASTTEVSYRQLREADESTGAYAVQIKPVLARISVIEEALCSVRSNVEKAAGQQSGTEQQLKELLSKLSASDKKNNSSIKKVKEQIREISDTQVTQDQEHKLRLKSLEKQLQTLSTLNEEDEKRLQNIEKQRQKLSTAQYKLKVEMESQTKLTENLVHVPDQLESVEENLDVLKARIDRIVSDCNNKHQDLENVTHDLAGKVMANTDTVNIISEGQEKNHNLLRELETGLQTMGADSERNVIDVRKQVEKAETNFQILCQMLNDRLTPLEQLRSCLNERARGQDENIKQLKQVIQDVAELKSSRTRCGFTAWTVLLGQAAGDTIKRYLTAISNVGGNFNAGSGIFTAPVDGLYVTSVSLDHWGDGVGEVSVRYKEQGQGQSSGTYVCWVTSTVKGTDACTMGVVDMKSGDTLSIYVHRRETSYNGHVWFTSFLLA